MRINEIRLSYGRELIATLSGPAANLLCGVTLSCLGKYWPLLYAEGGANFVLAVFNLLPIGPLDGGRGLRILLSWRYGPGVGVQAAGLVGLISSVLLGGLLVVLMKTSGGNLWLIPAVVGAAACAWSEFRAIKAL